MSLKDILDLRCCLDHLCTRLVPPPGADLSSLYVPVLASICTPSWLLLESKLYRVKEITNPRDMWGCCMALAQPGYCGRAVAVALCVILEWQQGRTCFLLRRRPAKFARAISAVQKFQFLKSDSKRPPLDIPETSLQIIGPSLETQLQNL